MVHRKFGKFTRKSDIVIVYIHNSYILNVSLGFFTEIFMNLIFFSKMLHVFKKLNGSVHCDSLYQ
jgi:hypothetical protein